MADESIADSNVTVKENNIMMNESPEKWLTVPEAAQLILEVSGDNIPTHTIEMLCRGWRSPQARFLYWVYEYEY